MFVMMWILPVYGEKRQLGIAYVAEIALTEGISAKIIKQPIKKLWRIHSPHLNKKGWDGSL